MRLSLVSRRDGIQHVGGSGRRRHVAVEPGPQRTSSRPSRASTLPPPRVSGAPVLTTAPRLPTSPARTPADSPRTEARMHQSALRPLHFGRSAVPLSAFSDEWS